VRWTLFSSSPCTNQLYSKVPIKRFGKIKCTWYQLAVYHCLKSAVFFCGKNSVSGYELVCRKLLDHEGLRPGGSAELEKGGASSTESTRTTAESSGLVCGESVLVKLLYHCSFGARICGNGSTLFFFSFTPLEPRVG